VLKPKRIVGLTALGVASIEGTEVTTGTELAGAGDVIIGLNPRLSSSVAPRGIPPLPTGLTIPPPTDDEAPDAVPAVIATPQDPDEPIAPELNPEGIAPALEHELLVAVGSNGAGLSPPGESAVAPNGIPTGPTGEVAPGIPRGDVDPIADPFGVSGAN
jgi:hypothetical protein